MVVKDCSHSEVMVEFFQPDPPYVAELLAKVVRYVNPDKSVILERQLSETNSKREAKLAS